MNQRKPRVPQEKDLTGRYRSGDLEENPVEQEQRFSRRSSGAQHRKMERTALLRAAAEELAVDKLDALPVGEVIQVYSLFCDVEHEGVVRLCVVRKTLARLAETAIVVGDLVGFRDLGSTDEQGRPEAVIERILPRQTVLTRADSFKGIEQQPIVANARQMLIVVSLHLPEVRWGLIDRMIVAAQSGGLTPVVCLNKSDLAKSEEDLHGAQQFLHYYRHLGIHVIQASVPAQLGLDKLRDCLRNQTTVLAGHSGVGKSSLIRAIEPSLDLRIGAISGYTGKGRHTTSSARRYRLEMGGYVIDTPGVKLFGLWGVTAENLRGYFPDIEDESAPAWRRGSFQRLRESLGQGTPDPGERND